MAVICEVKCIMTWPFCPLCGTILDPPELDTVKCSLCPYECNFNDVGVAEVTTKSAPFVKPSWIVDTTDGEKMKEKQNHCIRRFRSL